jgi:hypothetical protein
MTLGGRKQLAPPLNGFLPTGSTATSNQSMARGNSRIARAGPSSPASSSSPSIGGRQKLITGRIQGVDKDVSRIIYGTLFLHTFENDEACFDLLDSVWAAGCNAFDCAAI